MQQFEEALAVLDSLKESRAEIFELKATIYRAVGAEDQSRDAHLKVVQYDSLNSNSFALLAGAYRRLGNLDSTIWAYEHLACIRAGNYRLWAELGQLKAQNKDYQGGLSSFRKSLEHERGANNITAYLGLAHCYEMLGHLDSALTVLHDASYVDQSNLLIHRALRSLYLAQDDLASALPHAEREVDLSPLDREATRRLGIMYYWLDSLRQSDSVLSFLVASGDRHPTNFSYLGRIALRRDNPQSARGYFESVTQLTDSVAEAWLDLGFAYRQLQQIGKEIETYKAGLQHMRDDSSWSRLIFALGATYERQNIVDSATFTFEELIARIPNYHPALNYLGYMLADRGQQLDYARDLIERAVQLVPENAAYLDSYGWVFYQLGDYRRALMHLEKAVLLDSDPVIFDHLGDVFHALGETEQARLWWEKALRLDPDNGKIQDKLNK
jgi:tetratricopeptide (TPR) repeat protein